MELGFGEESLEILFSDAARFGVRFLFGSISHPGEALCRFTGKNRDGSDRCCHIRVLFFYVPAH